MPTLNGEIQCHHAMSREANKQQQQQQQQQQPQAPFKVQVFTELQRSTLVRIARQNDEVVELDNA
jgi:hypothetical protein